MKSVRGKEKRSEKEGKAVSRERQHTDYDGVECLLRCESEVDGK
jgi:hypothetical protein